MATPEQTKLAEAIRQGVADLGGLLELARKGGLDVRLSVTGQPPTGVQVVRIEIREEL